MSLKNKSCLPCIKERDRKKGRGERGRRGRERQRGREGGERVQAEQGAQNKQEICWVQKTAILLLCRIFSKSSMVGKSVICGHFRSVFTVYRTNAQCQRLLSGVQMHLQPLGRTCAAIHLFFLDTHAYYRQLGKQRNKNISSSSTKDGICKPKNSPKKGLDSDFDIVFVSLSSSPFLHECKLSFKKQ